MKRLFALLPTVVVGCVAPATSSDPALSFRVGECPPGCICTCEPMTSTGTESTGVESSSESSSGGALPDLGTPANEPVLPTPPGPCPTIVDGRVAFDVNGTTREVLVDNVSGATPDGPLAFVWHGTFGSPEGWLEWHWATGRIHDMVVQEGGLIMLPAADPAAVARSHGFPWWIVSWDCSDPAENCDSPDDFDLMDYAAACAVEQGLADPWRISTSGSSAGGVMSSYLVERAQYLAAAVPSSGGVDVAHTVLTTANPMVGVMSHHGGDDDIYCDATDCYAFQGPVEEFALEVAAANGCDPNAVVPAEGCAWSFLCESPWATHSWQMGEESAEFMRASYWGDPAWSGHVWTHDGGGGPQTDPPLPFWRGELNNNCYRVYEDTPHPGS